MTHFSDNLYLGGPDGGPDAFSLGKTSSGDPTLQQGVGPLGRIAFLNLVPKALATANLAALQALTAFAPMTLVAGTGITAGLAPDGSGATVYVLDCNRCISLTSTANLSGLTVLLTGYDFYGRLQTQLVTGPNNTTVNTLKAFASLLSAVPQAASASTLSIGTADIFGLAFQAQDAGYIIHAGWNNTLTANAGTFTKSDQTTPATNLTGDTRGTFAQSGAASNGVIRLLVAQHLDATQCGPSALLTNAIGVTPA